MDMGTSKFMNFISRMNEDRVIHTAIIFFVIIGTLASCTDYIDPSAANSFAAIIAVIGEYLYAVVALVLVVILRILRHVGITLAILGLLSFCNLVELSVSSLLLVCIGILMFFVSFSPIKQYEPRVIISKHFKMPEKEKCKENRNGYQEFFIQLFVGFIILVIEYSVFAK